MFDDTPYKSETHIPEASSINESNNYSSFNEKLIDRIHFSFEGQNEENQLPLSLKDSLQLVSNFFRNNTNNKLCLVFPAKEYAAQWLSIPAVLFLIENDFANYKEQIYNSHKQYKTGDKLKLNDKAIVEWVGIKADGVAFKTKGEGQSSGAIITICFSQVFKLQKTDNTKKLSSRKKVIEVLPKKIITPAEKLLGIDCYGNKEFIRTKICLVSKLKSFYESFENITLNRFTVPEYFQAAKIDENGAAEIESPLLISKNLNNLALYVTLSTSVSQIIIDGFAAIQERGTDFSDIDAKKIPTLLITDLSEIESFEFIGNYGFEFFNFTKENLKIEHRTNNSPFNKFHKKLNEYISFNVIKEICQDNDLEVITNKIHSIDKDETNSDLNNLRISLIQLTNIISRVVHVLTTNEILNFTQKINSIESLFLRCKMWLGDSNKPIAETIILIKGLIQRLASNSSKKGERLNTLLSINKYDYIITPTEEEAKSLNNFISTSEYTWKPKVISVADVNDSILSDRSLKALLTGWAKSNNVNRILSSFIFSELTVLFYHFENKYYNSLQKRNQKYNANIRATINSKGIRSEKESIEPKGFDDLYSVEEIVESPSDSSFDILEFELKIDSAQYSKYRATGNLFESIKAKRIDFENSLFTYSTESHKFLFINELIEKKRGDKVNLHRRKIDALKAGDVIALINTDRDILVELVEKNTNTQELASVKQWIDLWKGLLKNHYVSNGSNFKKLVEELRYYDCTKHEVTIKAWLQDESRIGPDDDADLISIALLTNSNLLNNNIHTVREAIRKMTGWRMKASDFIADKIKSQIHMFTDDSSISNKKISVEGLGSIFLLKIIEVSNVWENIDLKFVNRLLQKEII